MAVARQWTGNTPNLDLNQWAFKQLELNAQIVRFPSGLETEFAGQALYLLRVYGLRRRRAVRAVEVPLENTPNVQALTKNPSLRQDLVLGQHSHRRYRPWCVFDSRTLSGHRSDFLFHVGDPPTRQQTL